ncbi:LysR family transcriptional regulator [Pantoea ananatis]|uniref:LysR family transcriptional regulator n=1 Tax=Pantoea ananas TaxID=553 RepID=UPI000B612ECC|nr:LysR family transcriptional regulator [Pantoea ananatis]ASN16262.1 LysR family transcriptional regulator [Pantoea ananatis]MCW1832800.1 LysR family transcriptional regulator [Pantoea ananatis]MDF7790129.1 LysR family transcriptional regulator [Pantoea ananatis]MDI6536912.1 LysR family transcriptional regulator [Pantoea ananatis]NCU09890.1 LysR family transcriptional regulator [Pantoea ananatis]
MNRQPMFTPQQLLSFVAVCETTSFTRAAERVHLSQSTVSQQVRRLEEMVGKTLLARSSHQVQITEEGEKLLGYARRIIALNGEAHDVLSDKWRDGILRLGVPEDFAAPTAGLLARFSREHPHLRLDVMSGMQVELRRAWQREELDIMLIKQPYGERPLASRPEPLLWLDSAAHPCFEQSPVPLVLFPQLGLYREEICQTLDLLGRSWRIGYSSASLVALSAASAQGLGITLLPASCRLPSHRVLDSQQGLPVIDTFELALFCRQPEDGLQRQLADALADFAGLNWQ